MTDAASRKEVERSQKASFAKLQETMEEMLAQQKKLAERLDRKMSAIQAAQKQMREDISALHTSMAAVEEYICFAMANKLIDNLEQAVEKAPKIKRRA